MLDLRFIRDNVDLVREAVRKRHDTAPIDEILELDTSRRLKITELEELRQERNAASKERKTDEESIETGRRLRARIQEVEEEVRNLDEKLTDLLLQLPNIPHSSVPEGKDENDNVPVRSWGEIPSFDFKPLPHWELGEKLGIIDFERGVKITGSRFYILSGLGARLQRALIAFMLDLHTSRHDYQ